MTTERTLALATVPAALAAVPLVRPALTVVRAVLSGAADAVSRATTGRSRRVFVISGRDDQLTGRMSELLSLLGLTPMEWEPLVYRTGLGPSPVLHDVIRNGLREAQAIVALLTPDDIVALHPDLRTAREDPHELEPRCQPRPNVLMEVGAALFAFRERTILVKVGSLRPIADLGGLNHIDFDGSERARAKLVSRLRAAGCRVDDSGAEWRRPSRFAGLDAYSRKPVRQSRLTADVAVRPPT